jgi:hypothetical protein
MNCLVFFRILSSETSLSSVAPCRKVAGLKQCTPGNTKSLALSSPEFYSKETGIAVPHGHVPSSRLLKALSVEI